MFRALDVATSLAATVSRMASGVGVGPLGPRPERPLELYEFEACPHQNEQARRGAREQHVPLPPGDPIVVAIALGGELNAARTEPVVRFEPGGGQDRLAGRDLRQPRRLLFLARRALQRAAAQHAADEVRGGGEGPAELLVHDGRVEQGLARAAVGLGVGD